MSMWALHDTQAQLKNNTGSSVGVQARNRMPRTKQTTQYVTHVGHHTDAHMTGEVTSEVMQNDIGLGMPAAVPPRTRRVLCRTLCTTFGGNSGAVGLASNGIP